MSNALCEYTFEQIAINSKEKKKPTAEDYPVYLGLENLDSQDLQVTRFNDDSMPSGEKLIMRKGDVLFGKRRAYQKKVAIAPFDGIFSAHGMVLRPKTAVVDPEFFPFFISSDYFLDRAIAISVGSLSPTVNWGDLRIQKFNLPPIEEQRKAAALLWKIDALEHKYRRAVAMCDEVVKAKFIEMFSSVEGTVKLGEISEVSGGITKNSKRNEYEKKLPYLRVANVYFNNIDITEVLEIGISDIEKDRTLLKFGDLLFVEGNGNKDQIGRVAIWRNEIDNCVHQNHIIKARFCEKMIPEYAMNYFMSNDGRKQILDKSVSTSGLYTLSISKIEDLLIPDADIEEQKRFVSFCSQVDQSKVALKIALEKLKIFKASLINNIFSPEA